MSVHFSSGLIAATESSHRIREMNGWVKLHRSILDWEWFDDPNTFRVFIYLILKANVEDKKWRGKLIKRGSLFTSLDTISKEMNLTINKLRTSLKKLETTGQITSEGCSTGRIITILSYEKHQNNNKRVTSETTSEPTSETTSENSEQALDNAGENQQRRENITSEITSQITSKPTTTKEVKEEKNNRSPAAPVFDFSITGMTSDQVSELEKIRKQNGAGAITQRIADGLAQEFRLAQSKGYSIDALLTEMAGRNWKYLKAEWLPAKTTTRAAWKPCPKLPSHTGKPVDPDSKKQLAKVLKRPPSRESA